MSSRQSEQDTSGSQSAETKSQKKLAAAMRLVEEREERRVAKQLLIDFYNQHAELLEEHWPPAAAKAYLLCEMHKGVPARECAAKAQKKIEELKGFVSSGREKLSQKKQAREEARKEIGKLESEIDAARKRIEGLKGGEFPKELTETKKRKEEEKIAKWQQKINDIRRNNRG